MPAAGNLWINLGVNLSGLQKGLATGTKQVKGFASSVSSSMLSIPGLIKAAAASASAFYVKGGIDAVKGAQDISTELGVSVEKYQALAFAAEQAGMSQKDFGDGLSKMSAEIGSGSEDIKKLGISIDSLRGMDVVDQFSAIADAIDKLPTASERNAAAKAIFGRGGREMRDMMAGGAAGIANRTSGRASWGAMSARDVAATSAAADSMNKLGAEFTRLQMNIASLLAPAVKDVVDGMTSMVAAINDVISAYRMWRNYWENGSEGNPSPTNPVTPSPAAATKAVQFKGPAAGGSLMAGSREAFSALRAFQEGSLSKANPVVVAVKSLTSEVKKIAKGVEGLQLGTI